ncbi:MAG: hypothetical protein MNPFHGCM_01411 [Gemmatimonadaceae bacterium]|nr:hypothetical protein [Gemmatimonadaceae bacterium]
MSWLSSTLAGLACGTVGLLAAGWVANMAANWYAFSPREGEAGYFVVLMALLGFVVGIVAGIVASRVVAAGPSPGLGKALGFGQLATLGAVAVVGGAARLLADVAPKLNGQTLLLAVELRWPIGSMLPAPADTGEWWLRLSAASGGRARASAKGPLWREDARQESGRWVVPGAVEVFTSRGQRLISVEPPGIVPAGFMVPLPGYPKAKHLEWSEWLPKGDGQQQAMSYRFRVVPSDQPIRVERAGPFTISTIAQTFSEVADGNASPRYSARARFAIRLRDTPVTIERTAGEAAGSGQPASARYEAFDAVALLGGAQSSLLVQVGPAPGEGVCYLLRDDGDTLVTQYVSSCASAPWAQQLTSDPADFAPASTPPEPEGRLDRATFAAAGLFLFRDAVLDTRTSTVHKLARDETQRVLENIPPLGVSPDGRTFARLGYGGDGDDHVLYVRDIVTGATSVVPITNTHLGAYEYATLDPSWLTHYFVWRPELGGGNSLVARRDAVPLPPRGYLQVDPDFREYRIYRAKRALRTALIDFLVAEFQAEPAPGKEDDFSRDVLIDGRSVSVSFSGSEGEGSNPDETYVGVWMERGTDTRLVETIAKRVDAALATGQFNAQLYR